jgi:iron-sulfur cluster assembly protein
VNGTLELTTAAAEHLKKAMLGAQGDDPIGIRLAVQKAGCSGYEYAVEYVYMKSDLDLCFEKDGAKLIVDAEIFEKFLKNTSVDFRKEGLNEGLCFDNPNVEGQCGCGESFSLKDKE